MNMLECYHSYMHTHDRDTLVATYGMKGSMMMFFVEKRSLVRVLWKEFKMCGSTFVIFYHTRICVRTYLT
jgi:hypothetical protein